MSLLGGLAAIVVVLAVVVCLFLVAANTLALGWLFWLPYLLIWWALRAIGVHPLRALRSFWRVASFAVQNPSAVDQQLASNQKKASPAPQKSVDPLVDPDWIEDE